MQQPAWLNAAWAEYGVREISGSQHRQEVLDYFRISGHAGIKTDETPWCAAFVGAMLVRSGEAGSGSLLARSYLGWGKAVDEPDLGAIAVLTRGSDPGAGHVGFVVGRTADTIILLGGNQSDAVSVAAFPFERVLGYRWPSDSSAADRSPEPNTDIFAGALRHVLQMEGGYTDDPHDPGGPTNRGITLSVLANWKRESLDASSRERLIEDLRRISDETVAAIYFQKYWQPAECPSMPDAVALMHFDASVNHGVGGAARLLQSALGVDPDGEIGPLTKAALSARPIRETLKRYADLRRARYRTLPHFWRFGRGWLRRVDATQALALTWLDRRKGADATTTHSSIQQKGQTEMTTETMAQDATKWWLQSKTIWGAIITVMATVVPVLGPVIGVQLPGDVVRQLGDQTVVVIQAVGGLIGTLLTIYGRVTATSPLARRNVAISKLSLKM